jgi:hypothetical protein
MDLTVWLTYFIATIILSLSPGPGVFSSISSGLHHGFRLGLWNGVGMQAANVILIAIVSGLHRARVESPAPHARSAAPAAREPRAGRRVRRRRLGTRELPARGYYLISHPRREL